MSSKVIALVAAVAALAGACSSAYIENKPPKVKIIHDGMVDPEGGFIVINGPTVTLTLDAISESTDEDGEIVAFYWLNTGLSQGDRYSPDAGPPLDMAGRPLPSYNDEATTPTITVTLPPGPARFSVWATDDDGDVGMATINLQIGAAVSYTPDEECLANYVHFAGDPCETCACSPKEQGGCYDEYADCYLGPDQAFTDLCVAVVECAAMKACAGAGCYTADLCMAEIDAASQYMGGTIASCSDTALVGSDNPCRAVNLLGACTASADFCMAACQ